MSKRYSTIEEWIAAESVPFDPADLDSVARVTDRMMEYFGPDVRLLALGEALHGSQDLLRLRNSIFRRLVERHGFTAIALESSFPRSRWVNDYVRGRGAEYEPLIEAGFSHGFGALPANRELVEWMRSYNAFHADGLQVSFYGFDAPTEMTHAGSPRECLRLPLEFLKEQDPTLARRVEEQIEPFLGNDSEWENPAAMMDPMQAKGSSPEARELRVQIQGLIAELRLRQPELVARAGRQRFREALRHVELAQEMLIYHAELATPGANRIARCLGLRDVMMAANLAHIAGQERGRVFVYAHNLHVQRGPARWEWGTDVYTWWPAGAHAATMFGPAYAVIGTAVGKSEVHGIDPPTPGTLEALLMADSSAARFVPTQGGQSLPQEMLETLTIRTGSSKNFSYFPLSARSFKDFDAWILLHSVC